MLLGADAGTRKNQGAFVEALASYRNVIGR
jgi:hypothetical protein